ncbi:MAG: hypothetical protein LH606_22490 [Cytophagaceae bacterium]|nr:hypothetical protein [Cytophagaceae bacterium]
MNNLTVSGRWLWPLAIANLLVIAMLSQFGAALKTLVSPHGILSFEFAGTLNSTQAILAAWDTPARTSAGLSLGLDYLFLVLYGLFLHLACLKMTAALPEDSSAGKGRVMAWMPVAAAALDFVENGALVGLLLGAHNETLPKVALYCASIKFGLVGVSISYLLVCGAALLLGSLKRYPG